MNVVVDEDRGIMLIGVIGAFLRSLGYRVRRILGCKIRFEGFNFGGSIFFLK